MLVKLKVALAASVLLLSLGTVSTAQAAKRLTVADLDWTGAVVTCRTIQYVLENELGYKVKTVSMPGGPGAWEAVRSGDVSYYCETWPSYNPIKSEYMKEYGGDGSLVHVADTGIIGLSGYFVPRYMIEGDSARGIPASAPDLKSYKDLNKYSHMFRSLESGDRGNLIGCPVAAWLCEDQNVSIYLESIFMLRHLVQKQHIGLKCRLNTSVVNLSSLMHGLLTGFMQHLIWLKSNCLLMTKLNGLQPTGRRM